MTTVPGFPSFPVATAIFAAQRLGIPQDGWLAFCTGGAVSIFLLSRASRDLSAEEIEHYAKLIAADTAEELEAYLREAS